MEQQNLEDMKRLDVSSNLIVAYLINMGKALLLIAGLVGVFYLVQYLMGVNPFVDILDTVGIPLVWATRTAIACMGIFLFLIFLDTLSLTSYELVFEEDSLSYSYGSLFKRTKTTPTASIVRVNFKEYSPFKLGDILVEFTDTEERDLKIRYVSEAKQQCDLINKLMNFKKSQQTEEIITQGVIE